MTLKFFAEYKVSSEHKEKFLQYVAYLKQTYERVYVYEGVRQPGLYVEEWVGYDEAFFDQLVEQRSCVDHLLWSQLDPIIEGGRAKIQIWLFREI